MLKVLLDKSKTPRPNYAELFKGYTVADFIALKDLILLMQESEELGPLDSSVLEQDLDSLMAITEQPSNPKELPFPKYKPKSKSLPPLGMSPNVNAITAQVKEFKDLKCKHKKGKGDNFRHPDIIIKMADKGGNTIVMDRPLYV